MLQGTIHGLLAVVRTRPVSISSNTAFSLTHIADAKEKRRSNAEAEHNRKLRRRAARETGRRNAAARSHRARH
jgi:hypothetical protein